MFLVLIYLNKLAITNSLNSTNKYINITNYQKAQEYIKIAKQLKENKQLADFNYHPVGILLQDIFINHNREKLEIYGYSLQSKKDQITNKIRWGCDRFTDISLMSPEEAAKYINNDGIHLLINLSGYTS